MSQREASLYYNILLIVMINLDRNSFCAPPPQTYTLMQVYM